MIGTTKPTINAIRDRSHWNTPNIKPQNPVGLGLCSGADLEKIIAVARARAGKVHAPGAATAPDGVLPRVEVEPVAPEMKLPETPAAELEPEVSVESVFGDAPIEGEANKDNDPQPI